MIQSLVGSMSKLALKPLVASQFTPLTYPASQNYSTLLQGSNSRPQGPLRLLTPVDASWSGSILQLEGPTSIPLAQLQVRYRREFKTKSRRFPGHIDIYDKENGKREALKAAEDRFKRLDWGVFIRTKVGKDNKRWKMTDRRKWSREQHIFAVDEHNEKFERMFSNVTKRQRYFPDDPWEKFNRLSFWRHHATKLKNAENIRRYGNDVYLWDRYKAHLKLNSKHNVFPKMSYMPPNYLQNVASNPAGVYTPDPLIPKVEVVPHFQRRQLAPPRQKGDPELKTIRDYEQYYGDLPIWSTLFHPRKFPN